MFVYFCIEAPKQYLEEKKIASIFILFGPLREGTTQDLVYYFIPLLESNRIIVFFFSLSLTKNHIDMAKELAAKAKEAFVDDDFDEAVDLYSKAIDLDPNFAEFFADRAQANVKLENFIGNLFAT